MGKNKFKLRANIGYNSKSGDIDFNIGFDWDYEGETQSYIDYNGSERLEYFNGANYDNDEFEEYED